MDFEDMQQFDEVTIEGDAYENDWLEVKFAQKQEPKQKTFDKLKQRFKKAETNAQEVAEEYKPVIEHKQKQNSNLFFRGIKKAYKPVLAVGAIALLLVGMRFIDSGFVGDVFGYAKDTYTSNVADGTDGKNLVTIPSNSTISVSNGEVTLSGGSIATNFLAGKVTEVTDTSVTVSTNDGLQIVYSNLQEVLVAKDDVLAQYHAVGRYQDSATVNLMQNGEKVLGVSAQGYVLSW